MRIPLDNYRSHHSPPLKHYISLLYSSFSAIFIIILFITAVTINCSIGNDDVTVPTIDGRKKSLESLFDGNHQRPNVGSKVHNNGCASPEVLVNGSPSPDIVGTVNGGNFASIQEIQFVGVIGPSEQKRICKIKCLNGVWVGPLCAMEHGRDEFEPVLRDCHLHRVDPNLIVSHSNGTRLMRNSDDGVALPHGTIVQMRCEEIGVYKFMGNNTMHCVDGLWSVVVPHCEATTVHTNFSLNVSPSIVYSIVDGNSAIDAIGRLVIAPHSIAHFDCFFAKEYGDPKWSWNATQRDYSTGWVITSDDQEWKYRLSIYYAKPEDSGTLTCATPNGMDNSIAVLIKDVECEPIEATDVNLVMSVEGTRMTDKTHFSCIEGYTLMGKSEIMCQVNGKWSNPPPKCIVIECPELSIDDDLYIRMNGIGVKNRTYGAKVQFSCPKGFKLIGKSDITCLRNKSWSDEIPKCEAISCPAPKPPHHGRVLDNGRYLAGDYVQFTCISSHVLVGESLSICKDNGFWSSPTPICKVVCEFPGEVTNGHIEPTKFHYHIDESIEIICHFNYRLIGLSKLRCMSGGQWSNSKPHCRLII